MKSITNQNHEQYYDDLIHSEDIFNISTNCSHFSRRHDFDTFNMSDYRSCENCRHLDPEDRCTYSADGILSQNRFV